MRVIRLCSEANANRKTVFKVRNLGEANSRGSKGAPVSTCKTRLKFDGGKALKAFSQSQTLNEPGKVHFRPYIPSTLYGGGLKTFLLKKVEGELYHVLYRRWLQLFSFVQAPPIVEGLEGEKNKRDELLTCLFAWTFTEEEGLTASLTVRLFKTYCFKENKCRRAHLLKNFHLRRWEPKFHTGVLCPPHSNCYSCLPSEDLSLALPLPLPLEPYPLVGVPLRQLKLWRNLNLGWRLHLPVLGLHTLQLGRVKVSPP